MNQNNNTPSQRNVQRNFQRILQTTAALLSITTINLPARATPDTPTKPGMVHKPGHSRDLNRSHHGAKSYRTVQPQQAR